MIEKFKNCSSKGRAFTVFWKVPLKLNFTKLPILPTNGQGPKDNKSVVDNIDAIEIESTASGHTSGSSWIPANGAMKWLSVVTEDASGYWFNSNTQKPGTPKLLVYWYWSTSSVANSGNLYFNPET